MADKVVDPVSGFTLRLARTFQPDPNKTPDFVDVDIAAVMSGLPEEAQKQIRDWLRHEQAAGRVRLL